MEITDLPTLFQIATAQESNAQQLEQLGQVIEFQQAEIERLKKLTVIGFICNKANSSLSLLSSFKLTANSISIGHPRAASPYSKKNFNILQRFF